MAHITNRLCEVIAEWAEDHDAHTELPDDEELGKNVEFAATANAWSIARAKAADDLHVIYRSKGRFYVA